MKHIAVDIGNSSIKAGIIDESLGRWPQVERWRNRQEFRLPLPDDFRWWIASVNRPLTMQLTDWIEKERPGDQIRLLDWTCVPLKIQLVAPEKVGIDRLAAAAAAHQLAKPKPCIVIDAGTAVTVDGVDADGAFLGGCIFPGPQTALDQLAHRTDALPAIELPSVLDSLDPFGKSTEQAMTAGSVLSVSGGISEIVRRMQLELGAQTAVVLTGGLASLLGPFLSCDAVRVEHLVLDGIVAMRDYVGRGKS